MTSHGKKFEDSLCTALEDWVDTNGVVMIRRQSWTTRRGSFQATQECDIFVDSAHEDFYLGVEAKTLDVTNSKGKYGFYFSQINVEQFEKEREYGQRSGRTVVVAVEGRNYGDDERHTAWLVPLGLFIELEKTDASKVGWPEVEQYGYYLGTDREYEITADAVEYVRRLDATMQSVGTAFFDDEAESDVNYNSPINQNDDKG